MSSRDNFASGFLFGAIVGGVVGGIVGATLASSRLAELSEAEEAEGDEGAGTKKRLNAADSTRIEMARRGLEGKIAKLNHAIDAVRQQLGHVNGSNPDADASSVYSEES